MVIVKRNTNQARNLLDLDVAAWVHSTISDVRRKFDGFAFKRRLSVFVVALRAPIVPTWPGSIRVVLRTRA